MSAGKIDASISREIAIRTMRDIEELKKSDPFNRYWLTRLKQKRADIEIKFREAKPDVCSKDQREELRQQLLLLDELLGMMAVDERAAESLFSQSEQPF